MDTRLTDTRLNPVRVFFARLWRGVRELSGDNAYEKYLAHHAASHPALPPLSRQAYFQRQQQQQWEGIKRCC